VVALSLTADALAVGRHSDHHGRHGNGHLGRNSGAGRQVSTGIYLVIFWVMQIAASVAFKYGSAGAHDRSRRWLFGFVFGNVVGASSIYFLMKIFERMPANPNLAAVLAGTGAAIPGQIVLAVAFHSRLRWIQWTGIVLATLGTVLAVLGGPSAIRP